MSTERATILREIRHDDLTINQIQDCTGIDKGKIEVILNDLKRAKQAAVSADGYWRAFP